MKIDKNTALLYGIMLGDGSIGLYRYKNTNKFNYNVNITCNAKDDWPFINEIVLPLIKKLTKRNILPRKKTLKNAIRINFSDKNLFYKLKSLGFPVGKKGPYVMIPKIFYKKNLVKYIVQGFFATDGSLVLTKNPNKFYPRLELHATHKNLIKEIHAHLSSLGMNGHFYHCKSKPDPRWKVTQKRYKFQFNGKTNLILFEQRIGFINPKHKQRFQTFIDYSKKYDETIKGVASKNQSPIRRRINFTYFENAAGRI